MKLGSLFDGSGTCPLAASAVGIIPAWACEIELLMPKEADRLEELTKQTGVNPVNELRAYGTNDAFDLKGV